MPVVLVGGGSVLVEQHLEGASEVVSPEHAAVANAVGAAIAQVGGEVDRIVNYEKPGRAETLQSIEKEVTARAIAAGADPSTVRLVDVEEVFLSYLPGNTAQVRAKAWAISRAFHAPGKGAIQASPMRTRLARTWPTWRAVAPFSAPAAAEIPHRRSSKSTPCSRTAAPWNSSMRQRLGTGLRRRLRLDRCADGVAREDCRRGREALQGLRKLEEITGRHVDAVFPVEIGGSNGLAALVLALRSGLPVVDCDGMGRAFPESQMVIFNIRGQRRRRRS